MDRVLNDIVDEVALEGDQGCTVDKFFAIVEALTIKVLKDTPLNHPVLFDDTYKEYLWQQIKENTQLLFTEKGNAIDPSSLTYKDLKSRNFSITTTNEVLDRNIYGNLQHEKKNLNEKQRLLLNRIAKSRSQGISQRDLGDMFDMDPKTIFYHSKKLDQLGLIVKEDAYASKTFIKLLFLKRFANTSSHENDENDENDESEQTDGIIYRVPAFKEKIHNILKQAVDNIMPVSDLIETLNFETRAGKKWARVKIQEMHDQGEIEKIIASDGKKKRQCVRLIASTPASSRSPSQEPKESMDIDRQYSICRDLPSDYIFYKEVEQAGEKGLLRQALIDKYPFIDPVQFKIFFDSATLPTRNPAFTKFILHRTEELVGRSRQYRYYTPDGWKAFNESIGNQTTEPATNTPKPIQQDTLKEPTSIDEISLIMNEEPRKRQKYDKDKYLAKQQAAKRQKTSSSDAAPPTETQDQEPTAQVPSKRPNSDVSEKPVLLSVLKKVKKDSSRNNTKTRRYGILMDMVEKVHIRELNQEMMNEFKKIELDTPGGQNIARKTFDDLVKQLHEQKKLTLYISTIKKPNGLQEIKKFVLHSSLSGDSPQVKEFLENYSIQKPIMTGITNRKETKVVNMTALPPSSADNYDASAKLIAGNPNSWRVRAIENGWISSKWMRAKELHEALFKQLRSKSDSNDTVDMAVFLKQINLRFLMKIYGLLPYDDPALDAFLEKYENRDISIRDLPPEIRNIITQEAGRIRVRIILLLNILHALSLVAFDGYAISAYTIPSKLRLMREGIVRDYSTVNHPERSRVEFKDIVSVRTFWRDVQTQCLGKRLKTDTIHAPDDIFYNIVLVRLWKTNTLLTKEQKSILNSFVDFDTKTVPVDQDKAMRVHISRLTDLSTKRVQSYYNSISMAFEKYQTSKKKEEKRLQQKTATATASPVIAELMLASQEKRKIDVAMYKLKIERPFAESTFVASRKLRRLRLPVEASETHKRGYHKRVHGKPLSDVEKDVILHAYSIMKARAENSSFYWSPMSKVITTYTPERVRRAIHYMTLMNPSITDTIKKLKADWLEIYQQGISSGELKDEAPWETQDYDLVGFLEFFVAKLQERENQTVVPLPNKLSDLQSKFSLVRQETTKTDHRKQSASTNCFDEETYDILSNGIKHYDEKLVFVHLVMVLIKMILITPDEKYESKDGYTLLREFPDDVIQQAVDNLTKEGMLVSGKADYGRIPGRRINVSEKFLIMASGILPFGFFKDANNFHKKLATSSSINLQASDMNGGTVAAALELASQRKISINVRDLEKYVKVRQSVIYPKASAVSMRTAFIYKGLDLYITPNDSLNTKSASGNRTEPAGITRTLTRVEIEQFLLDLDEKLPLSTALYHILQSFGKAGASVSDIRDTFAHQSRETKDDAALSFFETLEGLENHQPPLVQVIGFKSLRYIASEFFSSWSIKQSNGRYIAPLMWYDTTGSIVPVALEGCANTTMSHILKHPGITFANLRSKFQSFFTDYELFHILKHLLETKRIIARKVQRQPRPKRVSIFDKRPIVLAATTSMNQTLNNDQTTCYWLAQDYYL